MPYATRTPEIADHEALDFSAADRVFVFGDVHGRIDLVRQAMERVGFVAGRDVAICVGDWMDRGDAGLAETRDFLDANPGVIWTRGNHEDILRNACHPGGRRTQSESGGDLFLNGGAWAADHYGDDDLPDAELVAFSDMLNAAPIAMTVRTPGGRSVGIVHAAVPTDTWGDMVAALEGPDPAREDMTFHCMWDRAAADLAIAEAREGVCRDDWIVPGIDHVFHGHTRTGTTPVRHGNQSWIDTGAYRTGVLTFVDVDEWCAAR